MTARTPAARAPDHSRRPLLQAPGEDAAPPRTGRRPASPAPGSASSARATARAAACQFLPGRRGGSRRARPAPGATAGLLAPRPLRRPPPTAPRADEGAGVPRAAPRTNRALARSASPLRRRGSLRQPARARTPSPARWALSAAAASRASVRGLAHQQGPRVRTPPTRPAHRRRAPRTGRWRPAPGPAPGRSRMPTRPDARSAPSRPAARRRGRMRLAPLGLPARCQVADRSSGCRKVRTTPACSSTPAASSRHCRGSARVGQRVGDQGQRLVVAGRGEQDRGPASGGQAGEPGRTGRSRAGTGSAAGSVAAPARCTEVSARPHSSAPAGCPRSGRSAGGATTGAKSRPSSRRRRRTTVHEVAGLRSLRWPVPDRGPTAGSAGR